MDERQKKILGKLERQCARREYCSSDMLKKAAGLLDGDLTAARELLDSLTADGFLDDRRYAAAFAREKSGITGWGPVKIRFALSAKRIPPEIIAEALEAVQKLRKLMEARWKTLAGDEAAKLKLIKYALSRGYDYGIVRTLAEEMAKPD